MKRAIAIITSIVALTFLSSCQEKIAEPKPTTYTVKMLLSGVSSTSAIKVDLTAFEYNEKGEKIASNSMDEVCTGDAKTFEANKRSVKVKLYLKMYSNLTTSTKSRWIQQVFYLEPESNIDVVLKDDTMIGPDEP